MAPGRQMRDLQRSSLPEGMILCAGGPVGLFTTYGVAYPTAGIALFTTTGGASLTSGGVYVDLIATLDVLTPVILIADTTHVNLSVTTRTPGAASLLVEPEGVDS